MFQSTHSLRSATSCQSERISTPGVSIHALLAECDRRPPYLSAPAPGFNPRTPCGVRLHYDALYLMHAGFQSTHSLRSATGQHRRTGRNGRSFNPRTPCGVRQIIDAVQKLCPDVSIHALLAECDKIMINYIHQREGFNPRTPCGVRQDTSGGAWSTMSFNPRTPCGVRQEAIRHLGLTEDVSIHALLAECDSPGSSAGGAGTVSIHALLAECDKDFYESILLMCSFNPRTPCGVRLKNFFVIFFYKSVSIHALLAECDCARPYTLLLNRANHTLRQPP